MLMDFLNAAAFLIHAGAVVGLLSWAGLQAARGHWRNREWLSVFNVSAGIIALLLIAAGLSYTFFTS